MKKILLPLLTIFLYFSALAQDELCTVVTKTARFDYGELEDEYFANKTLTYKKRMHSWEDCYQYAIKLAEESKYYYRGENSVNEKYVLSYYNEWEFEDGYSSYDFWNNIDNSSGKVTKHTSTYSAVPYKEDQRFHEDGRTFK